MEKEESEAPRCTECRHDLDLGVDAITIDHGVIGPRGFVPLGEKKFFCDEDCLRRHVGAADVKQLSRRIP